MGKIEQLPTSKEMSVETLLHMVLEDLDEIDGVAIVAMGKDGKMWASWSSMTTSEITMAALYLTKLAMRELQ